MTRNMGLFDKDILDIFKRYLEGKASDQEKALVDEYYAIYDRLPLEDQLSQGEKQTFQAAIYDHVNRHTTRVAPRFIWLRYVAAACVAAGLVFVLLQYRKGAPANVRIVQKGHTIVPGSARASILLADGSRVDLATMPLGIVAIQGREDLQKVQNGLLRYSPERTSAKGSGSGRVESTLDKLLNTIETPRGGYYQLILPDGSHIWLDVASSLRYNVNSSRTVELSGRAYFEIAHDQDHPFSVLYKGKRLQVLGTQFIIDCYGDQDIRTTVLEGRVRVVLADSLGIGSKTKTTAAGPIELAPGQQAIFTGGKAVVSAVDTNTAIAWKRNVFAFVNADIREVLAEASRWYDFDVVYDTEIPERRIDGMPSRNLPFNDFLRIISMTGLHFTLQSDTLHISR